MFANPWRLLTLRGKAFALLGLVVAVAAVALGQRDLAWLGVLLLLLPLVAGISYEILKGLAHAQSPFARALRWPGMQLQRLTTREPSLEMLEVAIASMNAALDGLPQGERTGEGYALIKKAKPALQ